MPFAKFCENSEEQVVGEQKELRNTLREKFEFYISDFDSSNQGFTQNDFNELIRNGRVHIEHIEVFGHIMEQCVWLRTCLQHFQHFI